MAPGSRGKPILTLNGGGSIRTAILITSRWLWGVWFPDKGGRTWPDRVAKYLNVSSPIHDWQEMADFRSTARSNFCPSLRLVWTTWLSGIENVGGADAPLTKLNWSQWRLIDYLKRKYPFDYVIGHHEYQNFSNYPTLGKRKDPDYRTVKNRPRRWNSWKITFV